MIALIRRIEAKGFTYSAGGNLYFDIAKFPDYGELALLDQQDLKAGARIEVDEGKKNPADFVLWFTKSKFEHQAMLWDSPWGRGYPGWHIECSAMSMKYLGEQFDIHCGGHRPHPRPPHERDRAVRGGHGQEVGQLLAARRVPPHGQGEDGEVRRELPHPLHRWSRRATIRSTTATSASGRTTAPSSRSAGRRWMRPARAGRGLSTGSSS